MQKVHHFGYTYHFILDKSRKCAYICGDLIWIQLKELNHSNKNQGRGLRFKVMEEQKKKSFVSGSDEENGKGKNLAWVL